jgi:O-antigen ligase
MLPAYSLQKLCDRVALCAVAWLLTFPVLAIGGLSYWSRALVQLTAAALAGLWSVRVLLRLPEPPRGAVAPAAVRWGVVLLALLSVPLLPLPPAALRWLSPHAFDVYRTALPGWPARPPFAELFATLGAPPLALRSIVASWRPLSLVAYDSWTTLLMGMSYVVLGAVVALYPWGQELRALRHLVTAVIVVAVAEAVYAFVQQSNGGGRILWLECPPHATCTGTYLNRNHFAGLLEMALPLLVARALATWRTREGLFTRQPVAGGWLRKVAHVLGQLSEPACGRAMSLWCLALLVLVALAASGSRSAFVATLVAVAVTTSGRARVGGARRIATVTALAVVAGIWLLFPQFTERMASGDIARLSMATDTLDMIKAFPLSGVGIGNFAAGFSLYRARTIQSWAYGVDVDHAHNDYLEWVSEAGLPAAVVSLVLCIVLVRPMLRVQDERQRLPDEALLFWGFATGALTLLVHALTDFNLHIPANALVFAFLIGGLVRLTRRQAADGPVRGVRVIERPRRFAVVAGALSLVWALLVWQRWDAEAALHRAYPGDELRSLMTSPEAVSGAEALALAREAAIRLPAAPAVQLGLARQLATTLPGAAAAAFARSLWAAPVQPLALLDLARTADAASAAPPVVYDLVDRAAGVAPYDPRVRLDIAEWYLQRWAGLPANVREHAVSVADAALALTAHLPGSGTPRQHLLDVYERVVGMQRDAASAPLAPAAFANGAQ